MAKKTEKPNPPENVAVIYARYSTDNQNESSIEAQIRACREYAAKNGYEILRQYVDEAKSGTDTENREQFKQMHLDSQTGEFSKVIVFSLDRFSRNLRNYLNDAYYLKQNGVTLRSVTEQVDDTFSGRTLAIVLMLSAELYVESVIKHVKKSQREAALKGLYVGGTVPLGYYIDSDKEYVVNEEEAAIVRQIFEMYADGKTYDEIINDLNSSGHRTKFQKKFKNTSLYSILHNEKYIGTYRYGADDPELENEPVVLEKRLPAIVDKELFYKVQDKAKEKKRIGGRLKATRNYSLSGMIHCALCNANMQINTSKKGNSFAIYYRCPNAKKVKNAEVEPCQNNRSVRKKYAERYILGKIFAKLFACASLEEITTRLNEYIQMKSEGAPTILEDKKKELVPIEQRLQNMTDSVAAGNDSPTLRDVKSLEEKRETLLDEIARLEGQFEAGALSQDEVFELIKRVKTTLKKDNAPECRNFFSAYIKDILVSKKRLRILF